MKDETSVLLLIFGIILCFLIVPGNEKGTAGLSAIAALIAAGSLLLSQRSFKQTEKTLKLTELEHKKREIEQRLNFFYYPVSNYFNIRSGKNTKEGLKEDDRRDLIHAESFRYLADDLTREQLEIWREAETDKAVKQKTLTDSIEADITKYQDILKDTEEDIQTFINQKAIEVPGSKKSWYKFW